MVLVASLTLVVLLLGASWYLITYRFREALRYIVDVESNGTYVLQSQSAKFSFRDKTVTINDAHLLPVDSSSHEVHYDVRIPAVFFSIKSWSQILFESKVTVDSFSIDFPEISVYDRSSDKPQKKKITVHASDVFDKLHEVKSHLSVRSFTLNNAAFSFATERQPGKFHSNRINFSVKNFAESDSSQRFLTSEHVLLDIADQDWRFPDNRNRVQFKQLLLSGEEKMFRIDSCVFSGTDRYDRPFSIRLGSIRFSSDNLSALYDRGELVIDSLLLSKPEITIPTTEKSHHKARGDQGHVISDAIREMFSAIQIKYIHVDSGMLFLASESGLQPVSSNRTDVKIYNLEVPPNAGPLRTDSIILSQRKIALITKDQLFSLNIERFLLKDNSLFLSDVRFEPTPKNTALRLFSFRAPRVNLKNIDLEALMEKKINADIAELVAPEIDLIDRSNDQPLALSGKQPEKRDFFSTLRALNELIDVDSFQIRDGRALYRLPGDAAAYLQLDDIDLYVRLNEFAESENIAAIEKSVSYFSTQKLTLTAPDLSVELEGLRLTGKQRKTQVASFRLNSVSGNQVGITGKGLEWMRVDWDGLMKKKLNLHTLHLRAVDVQISTGEQEKDSAAKFSAAFPLSVRRLTVDSISFDQRLATAIRFRAAQLQLDNIRNSDSSLHWDKAAAVVDSFTLNNGATHLFARQTLLNTAAATEIKNLAFTRHNRELELQATVPLVTVSLPLQTVRPREWYARFLALESPVVSYRRMDTARSDTGESALPDIRIDSLAIAGALLKYGDDRKQLTAALRLGLEAFGISATARQLHLPLADMDIRAFKAMDENRLVELPLLVSRIRNMQWQLQEAKTFTGLFSGRWSGGMLNWLTDSAKFNSRDIEGEIREPGLSVGGGAVAADDLLEKLSLQMGASAYEGKKTGLYTEYIHWKPEARELAAGPFRIKPLMDEKAFVQASNWQSEYVMVSGKSLVVDGLTYGVVAPKAVAGKTMALEDVLITTFRDKTLPMPPDLVKPMLGEMLNKIKVPVSLDSMQLTNASVVVDVLSAFTGKRASVPIDQLNAVVTGVKNFGNEGDSVTVAGSLRLYNTVAHRIVYKEAYNDSLYGFSMRLNASPMVLQELGDITWPFANVKIESGAADTLYAQWKGNKYAAVGKMHFYYDGLKVKLVKGTDSTRSGLFRRLASLFANDVLIRGSNQKPSYIFYIRDARKSVFNYWVKSLLSGALSSSVIFQEKKLQKKYNKHRESMRLPDMDF